MKHRTRRFLALVLVLMMAVGLCNTAFAETSTEATAGVTASEINESTVWSYLDDGMDPAAGLSERTGWTTAEYGVSAWKTGTGSFGAKRGAIADLGSGCIPNTLLTQYKEDGSTDIEAYFFRTEVNIEDASAVTAILGNLLYDDAATVYINGVKIAGFDDSSITENLQYGGSNAGDPTAADISVTDTSMLHDGVNVVAVEIHQGRSSSSDIYFAMPSLTFSTEPLTVTQKDIALSVGADETQRNFTWYADVNGEGTLRIAKASELVNGAMPAGATTYAVTGQAATNRSGYYSYQTTATGLEANTEYAYQVVNGETESEISTFRTGSGEAFSFAFVGDPQIGASGDAVSDTDGWENSLNEIATNSAFSGVEFMLSAGDQVNTSNNETQYDGYLSHDALLSLPVATVVGNHDSGSVAYNEHFNVPNESSLGSTAAGSDYYFVYNHVLFLVLNSNNMSTAEHKQFMENAIAATADQDIQWKIVTFHHSIYSVASHAYDSDILTRRNELVPVLADLDIDVVLMGHDHVYCRTYMMDGLTPMTDASIYDDDSYSSITNPTGILYVTANSASGSKFYTMKNDTFEYAAVKNQENIPNISRIDVSDEAFTITTYRTQSTTRSGDLSVVDTFTIYHDVPHAVTVTDGNASEESATSGDTVTLTANTAPDGQEFDHWEVVSGDVTLEDANAETTTFEMPNEAVEIQAVYRAVKDDSGTKPEDGGQNTDGQNTDGTGSDGQTADGTAQNGADSDGQTSNGTNISSSTKQPNTGDSANVAMWIALAGAAGASLVVALRRRKKSI